VRAVVPTHLDPELVECAADFFDGLHVIEVTRADALDGLVAGLEQSDDSRVSLFFDPPAPR
jgi:hypothetical protein